MSTMFVYADNKGFCGCQPCGIETRVRFPSPAPLSFNNLHRCAGKVQEDFQILSFLTRNRSRKEISDQRKDSDKDHRFIVERIAYLEFHFYAVLYDLKCRPAAQAGMGRLSGREPLLSCGDNEAGSRNSFSVIFVNRNNPRRIVVTQLKLNEFASRARVRNYFQSSSFTAEFGEDLGETFSARNVWAGRDPIHDMGFSPHSKAARAGAKFGVGIRSNRCEPFFTNTLSAGRQ